MQRYILCLVLSLLLTVVLYVASLWLAFCGDWSSAAWCKYAQYALFPILWPVRFIGVRATFLVHGAILFGLALYISQKIQVRRSGDKLK